MITKQRQTFRSLSFFYINCLIKIKMMKNQIFLSSFLVLSSFMFAQENSAGYNLSMGTKKDSTMGATNFVGSWIPIKIEGKIIEGSLYLFPNTRGSFMVATKNGDIHQLFNLNYNIQTDKLESFISNDSIFQFDLSKLDYIVNNNNKYKVIFEGGLEGLFLEVFNSDKVKLYKKSYISAKEGIVNPMTNSMIRESMYVEKFHYYFFKEDEYLETRLTKRNVLKVLSDKKSMIKVFVSSNKLSYSSEVDLKRILDYYISI